MIFLGSKRTEQKLRASLKGSEIELVSISEWLEEATSSRGDSVDIAIIEGSLNKAEEACAFAQLVWDIPVVVLTSDKETSWERVNLMNPNGYISQGMGHSEIAARLWAVIRRLSANKDIKPKQGGTQNEA